MNNKTNIHTGVRWLMNCYFTGRSPILADEMGLGKTIQTIGVLQFLFTTLNCR